MTLTIKTNNSNIAEKEYILKYIFVSRLGLSYNLIHTDNIIDFFQISNTNGESLFIPDVFFKNNENKWITPDSLPQKPNTWIHINDTHLAKSIGYQTVPLIYGIPSKTFLIENNMFSIDIFGSSFFLLTGYEELVIQEENEFGNFPYEKSFLSNNLLINRPIVDEFILILSHYIEQLLNINITHTSEFRFTPTHDIDRAFKYHELSVYGHIKGSIGDVIKRKSLLQLFTRNQSFYAKGKNDPYNTYEWLMNQSEKHNLKSIFYFKNCNRNTDKDTAYNIRTKALARQLKNIDERCHIIGIHPSYETHLNKKLLINEAYDFRNYLKKSKIVYQDIIHVRQHYLRYKNPDTSELHAKAGFKYDSSLGYNNKVGFRRGTCHPFPIFNVYLQKLTGIIEHPIILMEVSLWSETSSHTERFDISKQLILTCKKHRGEFVLLWHNEAFLNENDKSLYIELLNLS